MRKFNNYRRGYSILICALILLSVFKPVGNSYAIEELPLFAVSLNPAGAIKITIGNDDYFLDSYYSYPGERIGYNILDHGNDKIGVISVAEVIKKKTWQIKKECSQYSITMLVNLNGDKLEITESLKNLTGAPVGIKIKHLLMGGVNFEDALFGGYREKAYTHPASNPTIYVKNKESGIGIVAQDSLSRLKLYAELLDKHTAVFGGNGFALGIDKELTFKWLIYPLGKEDDYFTLINKIRRDWQTNFTIQGPWDFFDVIANQELLSDTQRLKGYFKRRKIGILAFIPWLDYDNFNYRTGRPLTREEYKKIMQDAYQKIIEADASVKVIGCMQSNLRTLPEDVANSIYSMLPGKKRVAGMYTMSDKQSAIIRKSDLKFKDSLIKNKEGNYQFELYYPMKDPVKGEWVEKAKPMLAINVYAAIGNEQFKYWLDQARFITEEVALDGIYIDQFNLVFNDQQRYSYDKWDGLSVELDPATGAVIRKYTDAAFAGIGASGELIQYIISNKKLMVANTYAAVSEIQAAPVFRFGEGFVDVNPLRFSKGQKPPFLGYYMKGVLGSPIILGYRPLYLGKEGLDNYAKLIMKQVIMFLRHGMLYYYFSTEIPETGIGSGEHGPLNHMFPITPVSLGEGFVQGKERIVTAVSGTFIWSESRKPSVLLFDIFGYSIEPRFELKKLADKWKVIITLNDWEEIAIIE